MPSSRRRALLPVRAASRSGGCSATRCRCRCRVVLLGAARRRRLLHRSDHGRRRRRVRRLAADPAVPAARRERLAAAHAHGVLPRRARDRRAARARSSGDLPKARSRGAQLFQTGLIGFGYFATVGIAVALGALHEGVRRSRRAARHRRRQPRAGQPAHHPGHAGRRAGRRPEWRRARPQRAGHASARRLRPHARRHAARRIQLDAARLLAALAGGLHGAAAAVQGRGHAAAAARAAGAHRLGVERRHADLPRGPGPRADRSAADEARGDGTAHRIDRARGAQSAVGDQPGGATARGGRGGRARRAAPARHDPQQREAHRPHRRRGAAA